MNAAVPFGQSAAKSRARAATVHVALTLAIGVGFAALLATGVHSGRDWAGILRVALSQSGHFGTGSKPAQVEPLRLLDPASGFSETRVGYLLFSTNNSDACRRMLFDNRNGASVEDGYIGCGSSVETSNDQVGQTRTLALLRAFRK